MLSAVLPKATRHYASLRHAFSTSALAAQLVRPPIQVHGVEGNYAAALYSAAFKEKALDQVDKDLQQIKELYESNKDFKLFVQDPTLNKQKKEDAIRAVSVKTGISKLGQNFLVLLASNGRLNKLGVITNTFESIMRAHKSELFVEVTSAEPLQSKHEASLKEALQKFATSGQKLHINFFVKPGLVGGLVVTIGDKYIDLSAASRLKKLTSVLESSI